MNISTDSTLADAEFPEELLRREGELFIATAPGLPPPHPAEADLFARHEGIPGHCQEALRRARPILVGAGGLNSWAAAGLLRSGISQLTIVDPDLVERTNLPRQLYFGDDLGKPKSTRLAANLELHAIAGGQIIGVAMRFEDAVISYALPGDLLVVGVDRNDCRLLATKLARQRGIPAIFTMLSRDGMRCHIFLQGPKKEDACLWCALPNLNPERIMPCASAIISSCFVASAFTIFFVHRALMGWPEKVQPFNWRELDLLGTVPDKTGWVAQRPNCPVCRPFR